VIWYNKGMFEAHGWATPRTWDELFALCEKIKSAGIAPMAFQGRYASYADRLYSAGLYHLGGKQALSAQRMLEPGAFDNPSTVQAYTWLQQLATNYFQSGAIGMSHTEAQL